MPGTQLRFALSKLNAFVFWILIYDGYHIVIIFRLVHYQSSSHRSHHPAVQAAAVIFQEGNFNIHLSLPWSKKIQGQGKVSCQKKSQPGVKA